MFFSLIKDFQSGLVGILGFIGVIVTLLWNARLAERNRQRERDQIRQTLQSALRQELKDIETLPPRTARRVIRAYRDLYLATNTIRALANSNPGSALAMIEKELPEAVSDLLERILVQLAAAIRALE